MTPRPGISELADFERKIYAGQNVRVRWTNYMITYEADAEVVKINAMSVTVRLLHAVSRHPEGSHIQVPRVTNTNRWSWNNSIRPHDSNFDFASFSAKIDFWKN